MVSADSLGALDLEAAFYDANTHMLPEDAAVDVYWREVGVMKDGGGCVRFPVLCKLVAGLLALPHGNADVERLFSGLALVKTKARSRLADDTVNAAMHVRYNLSNKSCHLYAPPADVVRSVRGCSGRYRKRKASPSQKPSKKQLSLQDMLDRRTSRRPQKKRCDNDYFVGDFEVDSTDTDTDKHEGSESETDGHDSGAEIESEGSGEELNSETDTCRDDGETEGCGDTNKTETDEDKGVGDSESEAQDGDECESERENVTGGEETKAANKG